MLFKINYILLLLKQIQNLVELIRDKQFIYTDIVKYIYTKSINGILHLNVQSQMLNDDNVISSLQHLRGYLLGYSRI